MGKFGRELEDGEVKQKKWICERKKNKKTRDGKKKKKIPVLCSRCEFFDSDHPVVAGGHFYIPTR